MSKASTSDNFPNPFHILAEIGHQGPATVSSSLFTYYEYLNVIVTASTLIITDKKINFKFHNFLHNILTFFNYSI